MTQEDKANKTSVYSRAAAAEALAKILSCMEHLPLETPRTAPLQEGSLQTGPQRAVSPQSVPQESESIQGVPHWPVLPQAAHVGSLEAVSPQEPLAPEAVSQEGWWLGALEALHALSLEAVIRARVVPGLLLALKDYTKDKKGDVGRLVREHAMRALMHAAFLLWRLHCIMADGSLGDYSLGDRHLGGHSPGGAGLGMAAPVALPGAAVPPSTGTTTRAPDLPASRTSTVPGSAVPVLRAMAPELEQPAAGRINGSFPGPSLNEAAWEDTADQHPDSELDLRSALPGPLVQPRGSGAVQPSDLLSPSAQPAEAGPTTAPVPPHPAPAVGSAVGNGAPSSRLSGSPFGPVEPTSDCGQPTGPIMQPIAPLLGDIVGNVAKQSVEKIARTREVAGRVLQALVWRKDTGMHRFVSEEACLAGAASSGVNGSQGASGEVLLKEASLEGATATGGHSGERKRRGGLALPLPARELLEEAIPCDEAFDWKVTVMNVTHFHAARAAHWPTSWRYAVPPHLIRSCTTPVPIHRGKALLCFVSAFPSALLSLSSPPRCPGTRATEWCSSCARQSTGGLCWKAWLPRSQALASRMPRQQGTLSPGSSWRTWLLTHAMERARKREGERETEGQKRVLWWRRFASWRACC